jgi:heme O synthase-like polyprenyltransferase
MKRLARRTAAVAWPAFMVAGVLEIAVFAFVDPQTLHTLSGASLQLSDTAVYSLAFFGFWVIVAAGCALTMLLQRAADEINTRTWRDD